MHMHIQARAGTGSRQGCSHSAQEKRKPDRMKLRYRAVRRFANRRTSWRQAGRPAFQTHVASTLIKEKKTMMEPLFRLCWRRPQMTNSRHCARGADIPTQMKNEMQKMVSRAPSLFFSTTSCHCLLEFYTHTHTGSQNGDLLIDKRHSLGP